MHTWQITSLTSLGHKLVPLSDAYSDILLWVQMILIPIFYYGFSRNPFPSFGPIAPLKQHRQRDDYYVGPRRPPPTEAQAGRLAGQERPPTAPEGPGQAGLWLSLRTLQLWWRRRAVGLCPYHTVLAATHRPITLRRPQPYRLPRDTAPSAEPQPQGTPRAPGASQERLKHLTSPGETMGK